MSRGMVSFLAGLGAGYLNANEKARERERQAKDDAFREEQRGRQRQEWQAADQLNADLKDAAAPRETISGTETTAGGTKVFSQTPENAAGMQALLANEAELTGDAPQQKQTTAATGDMARGHKIGATAEGQNTGEARNQRVVDALMKNGQIERAATMENTALEQKAKKLGLQVAELKFADDEFNRKLGETFANNPNWTQAAADVLTKTKVGGLAGVNVQAVPSADGKKVDFVGQGADGKQKVLATFDNSDAGKAQFLQRVMRAPVETKIGWIVEEERAKQTQANADREFNLRKQESESNQQYRNRMLSIQQTQESRAAAQHKAAMEDAKIPPAVKLQAATLAKQMETNNAALSKAMAEGLFDPNSPGTSSLLKQQADLGIQYQKLLQPYTPGAVSSPAAGLPGKEVFASPAPQAAQSPQPAAPKPAGPTTKAAQKQPVVYDPALQTVVNALGDNRPPAMPISRMQQIIQNGRN